MTAQQRGKSSERELAVQLQTAAGRIKDRALTKLVTVTVSGGASSADARTAAKAIANSLLVKTAIHGVDPNCGRLLAVSGRLASDHRAQQSLGPVTQRSHPI